MNHLATFIRLLTILAIGWSLATLLAVFCLCIAVPALVLYAKRLKHRGLWWALYVLGLHAALAPVYRGLRKKRGLGLVASRFVSMIYQILIMLPGGEFPLSAKIGKGIFLGHTAGIVLNGLAEIGDYCVITTGVVLGSDARGGVPVIGRNVYIGANAVIAGKTVIGDHSTIGAGAIVVGLNVPAYSLVVGNPATVVKENYRRSYHNYEREAGCE
jgi:serine O-acetyltransferase